MVVAFFCITLEPSIHQVMMPFFVMVCENLMGHPQKGVFSWMAIRKLIGSSTKSGVFVDGVGKYQHLSSKLGVFRDKSVSSKIMIQAKGIEKSFGTLKVLKGIDLMVEKSEVVSIMGASGAGKSTLLQILGTLSTPDSGSLLIDGIDVRKLRGDSLAIFRNLKLGFVFQFHHLLPEFTALENVMIPAFIAGRSRKDAGQHAVELLDDLGLGGRLAHKPSELSGGEQQRVAIARALINNPAVLLADEPSGNLDTKTKEELHNLFFHLREKYGQTIVIVTHDPDLAKMCDRSLYMVDGQFV